MDHLGNESKSIKLNPTQLYMYFAYNPKKSFYYLTNYIQLPKNIDLERFKVALNNTFLSHKIFCTRIKKENSELKLFYQEEDLVLAFQKAQNIENFITNFIQPFDLEQDKLYKFCLCECENKNIYFVFNIHHIIFDGVSLKHFLNEIADFYSGKKSEIKPELCAFSLDYANILKDRSNDGFDHKVANIDCAPKADINGTDSEQYSVKKQIKNSKEILDFLNKNQLKADPFFISIYALSLFHLSNKNECELLYSSKSRYHKDLETTRSIGMFSESFPIHFDNTNFKELYATKYHYVAHSTFLSSLDVSNIKIGYVYEDDLWNDISFNSEKLKIILIERELKRSKLFLIIFKENDTFYYSVYYNRNMYSEQFIQSFCDLYENIINEFLNGKRSI